MKFKHRLLLLVLLSVLNISLVLANPVAMNFGFNFAHISILMLFMLPLYVFTAIVEYFIVLLFVKNYLKKKFSLLKSIFLINLITFPLTQLLALFISDFLGLTFLIYLSELVPFIGEYYLLKWQFNKLNIKNILTVLPNKKRIILIVVLMNLLTFLAGLFLLGFFMII